MIRETAEIRIKPGTDAAFIEAVGTAVPIFQRASGCLRMNLERVIEQTETYRLHILWDTLEDHTVSFRNSNDFQVWQTLVGQFLAEAPKIDHCEQVVDGSTRAVPGTIGGDRDVEQLLAGLPGIYE